MKVSSTINPEMVVSTNCVSQIVDNLECGKSAGPDRICAEHLKFSNDKISILLALCFTVCLSHGYLPTALIETTIVPIVKNKSGNLSDSNNYRPIALATIVSKILESVILIKCGEYLTSGDNQFGFKSCHSTDLCIYALKEFIEYYKDRGTTIYVTFLDASTGAFPGFGRGGGPRFFFSDLEICMSQSDMLLMAKPCALLGGFGGMLPREIFLNGAIWCVLGCILIRFCLYFFSKYTIFYIKKLTF